MILDSATAVQIVGRIVPADAMLDLNGVEELARGWFVPFRYLRDVVGGAVGVIVNKETGKVLEIGFPAERSLEFYDKGYQFRLYDLVIIEVRDWERTLDVLASLEMCVAKPRYMHGTVWRIPRVMTRRQLHRRLSRLPCVFGHVNLNSKAEGLETGRAAGYFRFELLEYTFPGPA